MPKDFIAAAAHVAARGPAPADCVGAILPLMERLLQEGADFLEPRHLRSNPDHYARNAIHVAPDGSLSLFALVWLPGQWTPVHDHGSWGVVGVVRGMLEEQAYMSPHGTIRADRDITLERGGIVLLRPGSVTSFVPNPDHIHKTGVPEDREIAVTLHLYGRNMNSFHVYDVAAGTRRLIDLPQQET
jgi:predicted metal-dependent enzyme (double-stranded beta helix superfamily)